MGNGGYDGPGFPFLGTNLDFSFDPVFDWDIRPGGNFLLPNTVTSSGFLEFEVANPAAPGGLGFEQVGVVGATSPNVLSGLDTGDIGIFPAPFDENPTPQQLDALADEIQNEVDALMAANPAMNKIILLAHMQGLEFEMAQRLTDVDVIIGTAGNDPLFGINPDDYAIQTIMRRSTTMPMTSLSP